MNELVKTITEAIQEKKGSGIVVADLTKIDGSISNYFIICEGNSPTQVEAICESVVDLCRERLRENGRMQNSRESRIWINFSLRFTVYSLQMITWQSHSSPDRNNQLSIVAYRSNQL